MHPMKQVYRRTLSDVFQPDLITLYRKEEAQKEDFLELWQRINSRYDATNFSRYLEYSEWARSLPVASNKIIFIGDSHADFLSRRLFLLGRRGSQLMRIPVCSIWLGPRTAHRALRESFSEIRYHLHRLELAEDSIVFVVLGEIDLRCHFAKYYLKRGDAEPEVQKQALDEFWQQYQATAESIYSSSIALIKLVVPPPPSENGPFTPICHGRICTNLQ